MWVEVVIICDMLALKHLKDAQMKMPRSQWVSAVWSMGKSPRYSSWAPRALCCRRLAKA
jgi:hypothetical protein